MQRLWKVGHVGCGQRATLGLLLCLGLTAVPPSAQADSFVRRLAQRALERGIAQESRGDIAQALTSYDEAVRTDSTLGAAAMRLGSLRQRLGDHEEAALLYGHAIASPETSADGYYARALLRNATHQRAAALSDLAEAVARSPLPERLHLLGTWYVEGKHWPAALAIWRALLVQAEAARDETALREARVTVAALSWLASDADPVQAGATSPDWVRRSLARAVRRASTEAVPSSSRAQGVRKLTP
ncbi:MAG TPA: tetratricopeptide repeat protein [Polyangiaceae bacterium]|nr:tetratricopeptide repeat protein [Polyangiaceae bacterium]